MGVDAYGDYERIRAVVLRSRGVDLSLYRSAYVLRRIRSRMRAWKAPTPAAYARILSRDAGEVGSLLGAISTKVTSFFRNPALYVCLEARVLPDVLARGGSRPVRLWSAGCATGEEAYSLAALVAVCRGEPGPEVRVLGTDVDKVAVAVAKRGEYPLSSLRRVPADVQSRCFKRHPETGTCRVARETRSLTTFRVESLLAQPPAGAFDLILCRNVFIYFETTLQQRVLVQLASALRPGGYLALGRVERLVGPARGMFETVNARERVYRRL